MPSQQPSQSRSHDEKPAQVGVSAVGTSQPSADHLADAPSASDAPSGFDESEVAQGSKAARRQGQILAAARKVFVRDGYRNARLVDIASEAGCSVGTIYKYYPDRTNLLSCVLDCIEQEMRSASRRPHQLSTAFSSDTPPSKETLRQLISDTNRAYLDSFARNAKEMALLEEAAADDPFFRTHRLARAQRFVNRNAQLIRKLQDAGIVTADVNVVLLSVALSGMVSRLAFSAFIDGGLSSDHASDNDDEASDGPRQLPIAGTVDVDDLVGTVNHIWWTALGLA